MIQSDEQILKKRYIQSVVIQLFSLPVICYICVLLVNFDIFHPFNSIRASLFATIHYSNWIYELVLSILVAIAAIFHAKHFSVGPHVYINRWAVLCHVINMFNITSLFIHGLCAAGATLFLLGICQYVSESHFTSLTSQYRSNVHLNDQHIFVICHGFITGMLCSWSFIMKDKRFVHFPSVQQQKFVQIKSIWQKVFLESFKVILHRLHVYYILFYFAAQFIQSILCSIMNVSPSTFPLSSVANLIDGKLFVITVVTGMFVHFIWMFNIEISNVFLTQPIDFQLSNSFGAVENKNLLLQDVIQPSCHIKPLIQYLAFEDFAKLAKNSETKRKVIFSLSIPGGHPVVWNSISNACLYFLETMNGQLSQSQVQASPQRSEHQNEKIFSSPRHLMINDVTCRVTQIFKTLAYLLRAEPIVNYFTNKINRSEAHLCFANCQPCIWIVKGLSYLIVHSYIEDEYGIVQQQLPRILSSFLTLYQNLELQQKTGTFARKTSKEHYPDHIKLALELKQTLNCSIYRITQMFSHKLMDLDVDIDQKLLLRNFLDMKQ